MRSSWVRAAKRPVRRIVILFILALIVEYLVIPELVGASKNLYLLGRVSIPWMIGGLVLEGLSLFCYALLTRELLPPRGPAGPVAAVPDRPGRGGGGARIPAGPSAAPGSASSSSPRRDWTAPTSA